MGLSDQELRALAFKVFHKAFPCDSKVKCVYRVAHTTGHGTYFVAAWAEGKGLYAIISLFLLIMMLVGFAFNETEGE